MIDSILLIDDENLFHLVFEDACSLLDIALTLRSISSSDEADKFFSDLHKAGTRKPSCVFVDLNIVGSSFDGVEMVRRINEVYGNGCVIGIISSSADKREIEKAKSVGAQFWIVKTEDIEPRLEEFKKDYGGYMRKSLPFKVYK